MDPCTETHNAELAWPRIRENKTKNSCSTTRNNNTRQKHKQLHLTGIAWSGTYT